MGQQTAGHLVRSGVGCKRKVDMKKLLLIALVALLPGCSVNMEKFHASAFHNDPQAARDLQTANLALAEKLLCGGYSPADTEHVLRLNGLGADDAQKLVALAIANKRCVLVPPEVKP